MASSLGRFVWYELMTTDVEAARAFYAKVMDWGTKDASTPASAYTLFSAAAVPVSGLTLLPEPAREAGAAPHWIGYVSVIDVDAAAERIKRLGGVVHIPPTNLPNVSRFSIVADPQMATFALVRGHKPDQEQPVEPGRPGRVGWHELLAAEWEKAFAFYGQLLGWQKAGAHVGAMGTYQQFSAAGEAIGGMFNKPAELPFPFWLYYFNSHDVEAAAKRVEGAGGEILYGPTVVPGGARIVHCADPQGAVFALLNRQGREALGYFESIALGRSGHRSRRWSW
jgi:uncharacterized protein